MKRKKILSVDKERYMVNLIKLSFNKDKYLIKGAYSSREALIKLQEESFDIVFSEIDMEDMNGYELCWRIRKMENLNKIIFIFLTSRNQMNDKLHAIDVGADDFIIKPFDPLELKRRIRLNLDCLK